MSTPDWAALRHAYGSAADVPAQLAALSSREEAERHEALGELFTNIYHQGRRFEASAHAVPVLLGLAGDPATPERDLVLSLLAALAIGPDERWLPLGVQPAALFDADERATYRAAAAGVPLFRTLLADADAGVRCVAAYLCGLFPSCRDTSVPALVRATADPDDTVNATARVALGLLGADAPGLSDGLAAPRPAIRWASAIALARLRGIRTPPEAVRELCDRAGDTTGEPLPVPFLEGDAAGYAALSLALTDAPGAAPAMLRRLPTLEGPLALTHAGALLWSVFPAGALPPDTPFAALNPLQQATIRALGDHPGVWQWDGLDFMNFAELITDHALPATPAAMRAYAAGLAPGPEPR